MRAPLFFRLKTMRSLVLLGLLLLMAQAAAHDPSAWGGLFRSRDDGATWLPVDAGLFIGGAMGIAISPVDPNHLLYATDTRLLRSRNGGRDWVTEGAGTFIGPTLSVAFGSDGVLAVASSSAGIFRTSDGKTWQRAQAPDGAAPAHAILSSPERDVFHAAGPQGVYVSRDGGQKWERSGADLPRQAPSALAIGIGSAATIACVVGGNLWTSRDGGRHWTQVGGPWSAHGVETVTIAPPGDGLWVVADDQVMRSADGGATWSRIGAALGAGDHAVNSIAVGADGKVMMVATHRGILRSSDGGATWPRLEGVLPIHLEAAPLVRDPVDPQTRYAGFSLTPYGEVYRRAQEGSNVLARIDPVSLAGAGAFLLLLLIGGTIGALRLARRRDRASPTQVP